MTRQNSILGSLVLDFSLFYGASVALLISILAFDEIWLYPVISIAVFILIDSGHVYTTLWRTYFRREEIKRSRALYIYIPVLIFFMFFFWAYFGLPYLWRFVIYFTLFHHIRQYYGMYMWYAKLDSAVVRRDKFHLYFLVIFPIVLFHFRQIDYHSLYHPNEYQSMGELPFFNYILAVFTFYYLWQMFSKIRNCFLKKAGWGLTMALVYPATLHFICFLLFKNSYQIFLPLLALHGLTYLGIMSKSIERMHRHALLKIWLMILLVIILFAGLEFFVSDNYDIFVVESMLRGHIVPSMLVALILLPNLLHYIFDAFLWKKDHPDFKLIIRQE